MGKLALLISGIILLGGAAFAASPTITREQARSLAQTALRLRGDKVSSKQIQESTDDLPGYFTFGAYDARQGSLQNVIAWVAVNKRTGQVWDTSSCELYAFPSLERQRRKVVRHTTRNKEKPPCTDGQRAHVIRKRAARHLPELPEVAQ
jgi:hypothetical protein